MKHFIATEYFEAPPNALGRARRDDTQVNYWTRGDGRALSLFQHKLQNYLSSDRSNFTATD
jgi:hypothetical protein